MRPLALLVVLAACEPAIPIVMWHSVGEEVDSPRWVSTRDFEAQLDRILDEGYTPVTASELDAIERGDRGPPPKPIVLTFDDGYRNFYTEALPVLRSRGARATLFVISSKVVERTSERVTDSRASYVTWPEVREIAASGIEIQSHSITHRNIKHLDDAEVMRELEGSRAEIEVAVGQRVTVFAYPFGGNSPHTQSLVERAGYQSAHSVLAGLDERFARLRLSVHRDTSADALSRALEGSWWASSSR